MQHKGAHLRFVEEGDRFNPVYPQGHPKHCARRRLDTSTMTAAATAAASPSSDSVTSTGGGRAVVTRSPQHGHHRRSASGPEVAHLSSGDHRSESQSSVTACDSASASAQSLTGDAVRGRVVVGVGETGGRNRVIAGGHPNREGGDEGNAAAGSEVLSNCSSGTSTSIDDDMARMMMKMMKRHSVTVGAELQQRAALIRSIAWLGQHVPQCVLARLSEEISAQEKSGGGGGEGMPGLGGVDRPGRKRFPSRVHVLHNRRRHSSVSVQSKTSDITDDEHHGGGCGDCESAASEMGHDHARSRPMSPESAPPAATRKGTTARSDKPQSQEAGKRDGVADLSAPDAQSPAAPEHYHEASTRSRQKADFLDPFPNDSDSEDKKLIKTFVDVPADDHDREDDYSDLDDAHRHEPLKVKLAMKDQAAAAAVIDTTDAKAPSFENQNGSEGGAAAGRAGDVISQSGGEEERSSRHNIAEIGSAVAGDTLVRSMALPRATRHDCALLFVDISGFTRLSTSLDVESLSKTINSYFEMIVSECVNHGGDILKFAGDAIFVEWQATKATAGGEKTAHDHGGGGSSKSSSKGGTGLKGGGGSGTATGTGTGGEASRQLWHRMTLQDCVTVASSCGAKIVATCSHYPVYAPAGPSGFAGDLLQGAQVATLNVHCGVGVGGVAAVHVGHASGRRELLLVGDPIDQVAEAEGVASQGELVASPEVLGYLAQTCELDESLKAPDSGKPAVIAAHSQSFFVPKRKKKSRSSPMSSLKPAEALALQCEKLDTPVLKRLLDMISYYVHGVVSQEELASITAEQSQNKATAQKRHIEEAELRSVYVMFIMPLLAARISGDEKMDDELFQLLNRILLVTTRELGRYMGHLRQYIVDDKGVVLIATFGLRGSTFPNMISERALPCTTAIHNALQTELDVDNRIGGTFGKAYCGVVGGIKRHEYAVLGPTVNLAARLMASPNNRGILVDNAVRLKADKSFSFDALPPVPAKGYDEPVPIFEPLSATEKRWGKVRRDFVGRKKEMTELLGIMKGMADSPGSSRFVFLSADSGTGKSSLLVQSIGKIRKMGALCKKKVMITRNVSNEGDYMIPFSLFRSIFKDVLREMQRQSDDSSSQFSPSSQARSTVDDELSFSEQTNFSSTTHAGSTLSAASTSIDRLTFLMKDLNAPPEFLEIVGHHLLGFKAQPKGNDGSKAKKAGNLDSIVDFMARAFVRCTCHVDLVVMAMDDVHLMDELSWKVVEKLFYSGKNLLIVCASRPVKTYKLTINASFWGDLTGVHAKESRFTEIHLDAMDDGDVRQLIAKKLGCEESDVDSQLCVDLHMRSGGMPHFAAEILESIKRKELTTKLDNGKVGWRRDIAREEIPDFNFASVGELLLHRMDALAAGVRKTLHLCAVFGSEFRLSDLVTIYQKRMNIKDKEMLPYAKETKCALDVAVSERILEEVYEGGVDVDDEEEREVKGRDSSKNSGRRNKYPSKFAKYMSEMNRSYRFCHDMWKSNILKLMLDEHKRDMHRTIAQGLEIVYEGTTTKDDYYSAIKLFGHWKASGNTSKAAGLALSTGRLFENLGLHRQGINMYDDTLDMWKAPCDEEDDDMIGGFTSEIIESIGVQDLEHIVQLHVAKAKCLANIHEAKESVQAYQDALSILESAPASEEMKDRSAVFPIFSGLFVLLKFGKIEQDKECSYEKQLVKRFVAETELHGDPVHFTRALAMQGEVLSRLSRFDEAIRAHERLAQVYNVDEHSKGICEAYGSDRSAQSFSASAMWYLQVGDEKKAVEKCEFVLSELLPKMELRNVHNSMILIHPVLIIMKERGQAQRMKGIFDEMVVQQFYKHFGDGGFTFCLPLYKPILYWLEICGEKDDVPDLDDKIEWALDEDTGAFSDVTNVAMANFGRVPVSFVAEICLCLAKKIDDCEEKLQLIRKGLNLARKADKFSSESEGKPQIIFASEQNQPVLDELERLAVEYDITDAG